MVTGTLVRGESCSPSLSRTGGPLWSLYLSTPPLPWRCEELCSPPWLKPKITQMIIYRGSAKCLWWWMWGTLHGDRKQILVLIVNNPYKFPPSWVGVAERVIPGVEQVARNFNHPRVIMGTVEQIPDLSPPTRGTNCTPWCLSSNCPVDEE